MDDECVMTDDPVEQVDTERGVREASVAQLGSELARDLGSIRTISFKYIEKN